MAHSYFEEQIQHHGRGGWIGIRLGGQRARLSLGMPVVADTAADVVSTQAERFACRVTLVIQKLSPTPQESEVRELLKSLYVEAIKITEPDAKGSLSINNGEQMLGAFVLARWFLPASITTIEDLNHTKILRAVIKCINNTRTDASDVVSNCVMTLVA